MNVLAAPWPHVQVWPLQILSETGDDHDANNLLGPARESGWPPSRAAATS